MLRVNNVDYEVIFDVATKTRPWFWYVVPSMSYIGSDVLRVERAKGATGKGR